MIARLGMARATSAVFRVYTHEAERTELMHVHPHVTAHPTCERCGRRPSTACAAIGQQLFALCEQCSDSPIKRPKSERGAGLDIRSAEELDRHLDLVEFAMAGKKAIMEARAGAGCALCHGKNPEHAIRMGARAIRVLCRSCNDKQSAIRRDIAARQARLEQLDGKRRAL
jgi:hypothetical protein